MALLKLDLHLFHKDARKLSLIAVDVEKDVTVQHVLQQITSIYEITCDDDNIGIALFSEGFFIHPSLPSATLLLLPGTLLVRPVRVLPDPSLDGKRGKKRRIELLDVDPGVCCPPTSQNNSSLAVLPEGHGYLTSPNACGICCLGGKESHVLDSSKEIRSVKDVLDGGLLLQPPKKRRKKIRTDFYEKNDEFDIKLHSTPNIFSTNNDSVSDELNMPKKKSKKKRKKDMASCDETVEEITACGNLDGTNCRMPEDEEYAGPFERKSVQNNKKKVMATCNKTVENSTECGNLDHSNGRISEDEESDEPSQIKSGRKKNRISRLPVRQSTSVLGEVDAKHSKIEKSFVESIKKSVQTQGNYLESQSIPKSAVSSSNGTIIQILHQDDDICLQQIKGYSSGHVHNSDVVNSRTKTLPDCGSESDHLHSITDDEESSYETIGAVFASSNKRKRKRKHNKRLKREKKRLKALFLGDGTVEMPVEQQHQRQMEMQQIEEKYLKRDSTMLAMDDKDSEERRKYETQLKSVSKLGTKPGKVRIIEGNKFKREKCGIVPFQGKNTTLNLSDKLTDDIFEEASVTVSTDTKAGTHSKVKADVDSGQAKIKSTLKCFLDRRLQKTLMQDSCTPSILSNVNSITDNRSQRDLQQDLFDVKVETKNPLINVIGEKETSSSSSSVDPLVECSRLPRNDLLKPLVECSRLPRDDLLKPLVECSRLPRNDLLKPLVECSRLPRDDLLKSGNRLPTSMAMIGGCAENSVKYAKQPVFVDEQFSILRDMENSSEVSVFKYKRRKTNTSHHVKVSLDELSDSSSDSAPVSMPRRKKVDEGVRFPFRTSPNPTPFSPESDEIKCEFFFLSSIENPIEPLVYYRYNAYGNDVSSVGECQNDDLIKDAPLGNYSATLSKQTTASVSNEVSSSMNIPTSVIVHDVKPKENGTSITALKFPVDVKATHNGVTKDGMEYESQSPLLKGVQTCSAQEMSSAKLLFGAENISCSANGSNNSKPLAGDPPCHKSLEKSIVSSADKLNSVLPIQSPLLSYECEAMAGAASVHTGKLQCLQPMSNRQSKVFKPRVYSALGSLLQQLRSKASTEEKASANVEKSGGILDGVEGTATTCAKPRTLTEVPYHVYGSESYQDKSNMSSLSPKTEIKNDWNSIDHVNCPNGNKLTRNSNLENGFCDVVIPKKERGKRIRKRRGNESQRLGNAATVKSEPFQSFWDVTPEEFKARQCKSAENSYVESNIQNSTNDFNSEDPPGLPSVLSNIDVSNLPQVCGMPHIGDIVFFYVDDANFTPNDCPTKAPSVDVSQDAETSGDAGSLLNGCPTTNVVNPLTTCLPIDMGSQLTCLPTSNGKKQFVPVVGKVLVVSEGVVTLQLVGDSSDNASVDHPEAVIDLVEHDGSYNSSGVEKTVLWSSVACPKLVFP